MSRALRRRYGRSEGGVKTLTVVMPDGKVATRTTAHPYTYLVVGRYPGGWAPATWTTDPQGALEREVSKQHRGHYGMSSGPYKHISGHHVALELKVLKVERGT